MKIMATPVTAALAGAFSGLTLPLVWTRFGASGSSVGIELTLAFLLLVALPAHAFVLGFERPRGTASGLLDTALLKRSGAWLLAACLVALASQLVRS